MASTVYVGLVATSDAHGVLGSASFDHLAIPARMQCSPLSFGAVGDGKTDNTTAIQNAVDACAGRGGGTVELSVVGNNVAYVTGPFTLKSHVYLQIDRGVTLQGTIDHSRYVGAYINWVYQRNEALIAADAATDVRIMGAGTIDGAGGRPQPDGSSSWWALVANNPHVGRPWLLEFYRSNQVTISGVTLQNAPNWNQALRFSSGITESGVTVNARRRIRRTPMASTSSARRMSRSQASTSALAMTTSR